MRFWVKLWVSADIHGDGIPEIQTYYRRRAVTLRNIMARNKTAYLEKKYQQMKERGETWELQKLQSPSKAHAQVEGEDVIMLASNNYLDLANDPRLREAAIDAIEEYGVGAGSVRT
jgi:glycine C-acetyltransferase